MLRAARVCCRIMLVSKRTPGAFPALVSIALLSCAGENVGSALARAPEFRPAGQALCGVVKSPLRPLIVEWPSPDRVELENKVHEGVVIVHYAGCEMRVLERCSVPARYAYLGATRTVDKVVVTDDDELYASLPVGAASLAGQLRRAGRLTVDMDLVGRFEAVGPEVRTDDLRGDCDGATHFIYAAAIGAFDFYAGGHGDVGAQAGIAGIAAGGRSQAQRETLTKAGDEAACARATPDDKAPPPECGAIIRLEIAPLAKAEPLAPTCPSGQQWDGVECVAVPAGAAPAAAGMPSGASCPAGMAQLPGGTFTMGDRGDRVTVQRFCLDATEVTVQQEASCVQQGKCAATHLGQWSDDGRSFIEDDRCNYGADTRAGHPINCVDWEDAATYCRVQDKRLPTEEEWEWAARGGTAGNTYPWGRQTPHLQLCWSGVAKRNGTCEVGSHMEGDAPGGLHDLAGNVWEWTASAYDSQGTTRVHRGGSWYSDYPSFVGVSRRAHSPAAGRYVNLGFRCAR